MWQDMTLIDTLPRSPCPRCHREVLVRTERVSGRAVYHDVRTGCDGERVLSLHRCEPNPDAMPLLEGYVP